MNYKDYFVIDNIAANSLYLREVLDEIVTYYQNLGADFDYKQKIVRTWIGLNPQFVCANDPVLCDEIHIAMSDCNYWCPLVFQLSHELHHLFTKIHNVNNMYIIKWVEEMICEAISLYFLKYYFLNYKNTSLYKYNPNFAKYFNEYLIKEINSFGNYKLSEIKGYNELLKFEDYVYTNRENHHKEKIQLFYLINEEAIVPLLNIKKYYDSNYRIINTSSLLRDYGHIKAIRYICELQDQILK